MVATNDLLNSFKYANFVIDEERDLALLGQIDDSNDRNIDLYPPDSLSNMKKDCQAEWSNIIPIEEIEKFKESNKSSVDSELTPRPRVLFNVQLWILSK
jgi:hypothetical protein